MINDSSNMHNIKKVYNILSDIQNKGNNKMINNVNINIIFFLFIFFFQKRERQFVNKKRKGEHSQNINYQNNNFRIEIKRLDQKNDKLEITEDRNKFYNDSRECSMSCAKLNDNKYYSNSLIPVLPHNFFSSS